jgi:glutamine amidotransferase
MSTVAVIDYGMGNLHSIAKALQHADTNVSVSVVSDPQAILNADRVVFPGVGAMRDCIQALSETGLDEVIRQVAAEKPLLGICLGMQALLTDSEENQHTDCLGIIPGQVVHFEKGLVDSNGNALKIPHMGWNQVHQKPHPLWHNIADNSRFYFVHSYFAKPDQAEHCLASSHYGLEFCCTVAKDNLFAVQFHPEKSQQVGLQLLHNFLQWDGTV